MSPINPVRDELHSPKIHVEVPILTSLEMRPLEWGPNTIGALIRKKDIPGIAEWCMQERPHQT